MNIKYQIQIKTNNYEGGSPIITKEISSDDLIKFANLAAMINKNSGGKHWNWFKGLPVEWDGNNYVADTISICRHMQEYFNYDTEDINLVKEFYFRFTPHGCDGISYIKFFKVEEITEL